MNKVSIFFYFVQWNRSFFQLGFFFWYFIYVVVLFNLQGRFKTGSPQSTLCAIGSGCNCRKGSSQGSSPNGVCEDSSARATWDLLHAAAGEVERMRLNQQSYNLPNNTTNEKIFVPQTKTSPVTVTLPSKNNAVSTNHEMSFFTQPSLSHQQLQIAQVSF
jgi:hypothetical protein